MDSVLHVEYIGHGDLHDDLVLTIGSCRHVADTYYLAIENHWDSEESSDVSGHVRSRIVDLLASWIEDLARLNEHTRYVVLPFDFQDQCTAWLEVRRVSGMEVEVQLGWSDIEGWRVLPSQYFEASPHVGRLEPIGGAWVLCKSSDLVASIEASRKDLSDAL